MHLLSNYHLSQHWLKNDTIRQQAIAWANFDPGLYRHIASPGHNNSDLHKYLHFFSFAYHLSGTDTNDFLILESIIILTIKHYYFSLDFCVSFPHWYPSMILPASDLL